MYLEGMLIAGEAMEGEVGGLQKPSVLYVQFYCEPKTAPKV